MGSWPLTCQLLPGVPGYRQLQEANLEAFKFTITTTFTFVIV